MNSLSGDPVEKKIKKGVAHYEFKTKHIERGLKLEGSKSDRVKICLLVHCTCDKVYTNIIAAVGFFLKETKRKKIPRKTTE